MKNKSNSILPPGAAKKLKKGEHILSGPREGINPKRKIEYLIEKYKKK